MDAQRVEPAVDPGHPEDWGRTVLAHDPLLLPGVSLWDDPFCGNGPESGREGILQP